MPKDTFHNLAPTKQAQIRHAAEDEFARSTFSQASLSRIVERAGIAKGSIYQYFDNKLGLYRWLLEEATKKKLSYLKLETPAPGKFFEWLDDAFLAGLSFAREHPRFARIGWTLRDGGDPALAPIARRLRRAGLDHMESLVREAQVHGEIRAELDPKVVALLIGGMQASVFEALCAMAGVDSFEALLDDGALARIDDNKLATLVHQLMQMVRTGVAAAGDAHPVDGVRAAPFDVAKTMDEVFNKETDQGGRDE